MSLRYLDADILGCGAQFVAHQCNASTPTAKGLAAAVFRAQPRANTYARHECRTPGTIDVFLPENGQPGIINCNAQRGPGRPQGMMDTAAQRLEWFGRCLEHISALEGLTSVAFPHRVGCGMAGGNWEQYERLLISFASSHPAVDVVVCKLPAASGALSNPRKRKATIRSMTPSKSF